MVHETFKYQVITIDDREEIKKNESNDIVFGFHLINFNRNNNFWFNSIKITRIAICFPNFLWKKKKIFYELNLIIGL